MRLRKSVNACDLGHGIRRCKNLDVARERRWFARNIDDSLSARVPHCIHYAAMTTGTRWIEQHEFRRQTRKFSRRPGLSRRLDNFCIRVPRGVTRMRTAFHCDHPGETFHESGRVETDARIELDGKPTFAARVQHELQPCFPQRSVRLKERILTDAVAVDTDVERVAVTSDRHFSPTPRRSISNSIQLFLS